MATGIKKVAELAGVSIATVSHVINKTRFVSEDTKKKVELAMEQLKYRPNSVAQSLRNQKSNTIGLIVPILPSDTSNFFFMTIARGIQNKLKAHGYHLLLSNNSTEEVEEEKEQIRIFNSKRVDGLIIASVSDDASYLKEIFKPGFPVVFIDRNPLGFPGSCVLSDGLGGSYNAVRLLLEKGHKRIGFLTGELGITTSNERIEGYKSALESFGIPFDKSLVRVAKSSFDDGFASVEELLMKGITALFVANNVLTMGSINYLQGRGVRIPDELALIGFDDYDWTKITNPPLTVIRQPSYEIGYKAAEIMLNKMNGKNKGNKEYRLPTELVIRGSC